MKLKEKIEIRCKNLKTLCWYYVLQRIEDFVRFYIFQCFLLFHDKFLSKKWICKDIMKDAKNVLLLYIFFIVCKFRREKNAKIAARIAVNSAFFLFLPPDFSYKIVYNWPPVSKIELFLPENYFCKKLQSSTTKYITFE